MWDFMLDVFLDPFIDLFTGRLQWSTWLRHVFVCLLLGAMTLGCVAALWIGWGIGSWFLGILGLVGTLFFGYIDIRYAIWWAREGRHWG